MPSDYVQCLVCGRVTPTVKGICYHCNAPLPGEVRIPSGHVVCPNCLRVTPVDTGYCRRCQSPLPPELVREALERYRGLRGSQAPVYGRVVRLGAYGVVLKPGAWVNGGGHS